MQAIVTKPPQAAAAADNEVYAWYLTTSFGHDFDYVPLIDDDRNFFSDKGPDWIECASGSITVDDESMACPETACRTATMFIQYRTSSPLSSKIFCDSDGDWKQQTYYKNRPPRTWEAEDLDIFTSTSTYNDPGILISFRSSLPVTNGSSATSPGTSLQVPTLPTITDTIEPNTGTKAPDSYVSFPAPPGTISTITLAPASNLPSVPGPSPAQKHTAEFYVAIVVGGVVFIGAIAVSFLFLRRVVRNRRSRKQATQAGEQGDQGSARPVLVLETKPPVYEVGCPAHVEIHSPTPTARCELP